MTEKASDDKVFQSSRFRMGRGEFCAVMFKLWGGKAVTILSILLALSLTLGLWLDMRFFIITLMVAFIVAPMILGFMYYYYGLGERCYFNVTDHTIEVADDGITVRMYFPEYTDDEEGSADDEPAEKCIEKSMCFNLLHRYYVRRKCVVFPLGVKNIDGFLWLPESAFETPEEFALAIKYLSKKLKIS